MCSLPVQPVLMPEPREVPSAASSCLYLDPDGGPCRDGRPPRNGINVPEWRCHQPPEPRGAPTTTITTVGIDLAKNVFQVHGIDEHGKAVLKKQLRRDQMAAFFVNLPVCLIGMEACGSAHHWRRKLQSMCHTVRLMAPQFVKPYVKTKKKRCG